MPVSFPATVVTDPNGNATTYEYECDAMIKEIDAEGNSATKTYDLNYNKVVDGDFDGHGTWVQYDNTGNASTIHDANGNITNVTYNSYNCPLTKTSVIPLTSTTPEVDIKTTYTYDSSTNHLLTVTDAMTNPGVSHYSYYTSGPNNHLLQSVSDPLGHVTSSSYDPNGYVNSVTDANGNTTLSSYNNLGWLLWTSDALNHVTSYGYDNWGRVTSVTANDGTVLNTYYDADSNITAVLNPDSLVGTCGVGLGWVSNPQSGFSGALAFPGTSGAYIDTGSKIAPAVDTSQSFSVASWVKVTATKANAIATQSGANNDGFRFLVNNGNSAFFGLNSFDSTSATISNVWSGTLSNNTWYHLVGVFNLQSMTISIYVNGALAATQTLPSGWTPWKASGHLLIGSGIGGSYPFAGQLSDFRLYNRALTSTEISALYAYRPTTSSYTAQVSNGLNHYFPMNEGSGSYTYDYCHGAFNYYDNLNRITQSVNGRGDAVTYSYDGVDPRGNGRTQRGLLSSKTDGNGHTTYYGYTVRNEPEYTLYPDGTTEGSTYDPDGREVLHFDSNGNHITTAYDPVGNTTSVKYNNSTTHDVSYTYDALNRRTAMADGIGTTTWTYDNDSRVKSMTTPLENVNYKLDAAGRNLESDYTSPFAAAWSYWFQYDSGNHLTAERDPYSGHYVNLSYNQDNTLKSRTAVWGAITNYNYTSTGQVASISTTLPSTATIASTAYQYDDAGEILWKSETTGSGIDSGKGIYSTFNYQYDGADMITLEQRSSFPSPYTYRYTYDHNENRLSKDWGTGAVDGYTYDNHDKMLTAGPYSFTYDNNGNTKTISYGGNLRYSYNYDLENRLINATSATGQVDTYGYDGEGGRVRVADSYSAARWQYLSGVGATASLLNDGGQTIYTPGFSEKTYDGSEFAYVPDALGSTMGILDSNNLQIAALDYDAFGNQVQVSDLYMPLGPVFAPAFAGAQGYQTDADTGLIRCGNRYYNPCFGRFITQDPVGDGDNWYAYTNNDPVANADPTGEWVPQPFSVSLPPGLSSEEVRLLVIAKLIENGALPGESYSLVYNGKTLDITIPGESQADKDAINAGFWSGAGEGFDVWDKHFSQDNINTWDLVVKMTYFGTTPVQDPRGKSPAERKLLGGEGKSRPLTSQIRRLANRMADPNSKFSGTKFQKLVGDSANDFARAWKAGGLDAVGAVSMWAAVGFLWAEAGEAIAASNQAMNDHSEYVPGNVPQN